MAGSLLLPPSPRGLFDEGARIARLDAAIPQILACVRGETDAVALQATLAFLLWETMLQTSWCGFYRRVAESELAVGPYVGHAMGCLRIGFDRGVCGAAARTRAVQRVPDVEQFPGHIACDSRSRSELVVPVTDQGGALVAVLDLDSEALDAFSEAEGERLRRFLDEIFRAR